MLSVVLAVFSIIVLVFIVPIFIFIVQVAKVFSVPGERLRVRLEMVWEHRVVHLHAQCRQDQRERPEAFLFFGGCAAIEFLVAFCYLLRKILEPLHGVEIRGVDQVVPRGFGCAKCDQPRTLRVQAGPFLWAESFPLLGEPPGVQRQVQWV